VDSTQGLALVEPSEDLAAAYLDMVHEFEATGGRYPYNDAELAKRDFAAFVRDLRDEALGVGLPPGVVPQITYVLMQDRARALGEIRFRPTLTPPFERHHGHIGYNVRPSERGKGYATGMLGMVLDKARAMGLDRVMLPVEGENPASVRVIEKNGGRLERRIVDPESGTPVSLFWIDL
jgi:predicted acetyltransferase